MAKLWKMKSNEPKAKGERKNKLQMREEKNEATNKCESIYAPKLTKKSCTLFKHRIEMRNISWAKWDSKRKKMSYRFDHQYNECTVRFDRSVVLNNALVCMCVCVLRFAQFLFFFSFRSVYLCRYRSFSLSLLLFT